MKIAMAQINTIVGDLAGNTKLIIEWIEQARQAEVELVIFPELCVTSYPPKDLLHNDHFLADNRRALDEIVKASAGIYVVVGFIDFDTNNHGADGRTKKYNAAALAYDGKLIGIQHKTLLPTHDVFDEQRYFSSATEYTVFDIGSVKLGMQICEDLWDEHYGLKVTEELANKGADIIVNISASPFFCGKVDLRLELLKEQAKRFNVDLFYVNSVGGQDDLVFDGGSLAVSATGDLLACGNRFAEDLVIVDDRQAVTMPAYSEDAEISAALVLGVRDYFRKCRFPGAVIGLSGGIDSAVTAVIAVAALGKDNVIGVSMPSRYSSQHSEDDAKQLADNLGIRYESVPIEPMRKAFLASLKDVFEGYEEDLTEENIQARIRGVILMAMSNKFQYLLLSTGNKSEMAVGYCTLYGDMAGGYSVLSDVLKTKVYDLARYINRDSEIIPQNTITKPPSAELRPDQCDQDSLPEYEVLDAILLAYIEENKTIAEIVSQGFGEKLVREIVAMLTRAEFKRQQAAPGVKITPKAFGPGRSMPIVNYYNS